MRTLKIFKKNFPFTAQKPKWQNSCSQMWPKEQLYIELGSLLTSFLEPSTKTNLMHA